MQTLYFSNVAGKRSSLLTTSAGVRVMADGTFGPPHLRRTSESSSARCNLWLSRASVQRVDPISSDREMHPPGSPTLLNRSSRDDDTLRDQARARRGRFLDAQTLQRRPQPAEHQAQRPSRHRMPAVQLEAGLAASQP